MIRFTHILIAMGLILLAGILSARHLEERMGVSAVPGLVLLDCPDLGASSLEELRGFWPNASLEWVPAQAGLLQPFDPGFVRRHVRRGDATALFASMDLDREAPGVAAWRVVLDEFPGEEPTERATAVAECVVDFMSQRSGSRPFVVGVAVEEGLSQQAVARIADRFVDAARTYPESRRTALVVLGQHDRAAVAGQANRRWCLRIPMGDWSRLQQAELRDLLETAEQADPGADR